MWWPPRNEREFALARAVEQLRAWFSEQPFVEGKALAYGYGTAWSHERGGGLVPVILLDEDRFERTYRRIFDDRRSPRAFPQPLPVDLIPQFESLRLPRTLLPLFFLPITVPRAASVADEILSQVLAVRNPIVCGLTGEMGTAGIRVKNMDGAICLLSAGHVFPEGGDSPVLQARWKFFRHWRKTPLGKVIYHVVPPRRGGGCDAAVIGLDRSLRAGLQVTANPLRHFDDPEPVVAYGAFSGTVRNAYIHGGLERLRSVDYEWKNCWMTAPSGVLSPGDSGAAVFTRRDHKFLGLYIGQCRVGGVTGLHYVQDSYTLQKEVLDNWNIQL